MPGSALLAPNATIPWPSYSSQLDYEVELAVVIGKTCKDISAQQAGDCIFGYTIANDISARSVTYKAGRVNRPRDDIYDWLAGKWADGFLPLGPWVVSADEIGEPRKSGN
jgi:2-keto-4-pentenoate hydratase/2-oxohepta-3-ene-1,7-dioic acid hydratase in catechol pathway